MIFKKDNNYFKESTKKSYSDSEKKQKKDMGKNILEIKDEIKVNVV